MNVFFQILNHQNECGYCIAEDIIEYMKPYIKYPLDSAPLYIKVWIDGVEVFVNLGRSPGIIGGWNMLACRVHLGDPNCYDRVMENILKEVRREGILSDSK